MSKRLKMAGRIRKGSLSYYLLLGLEKTIDEVVSFNDLINNPKYYAYGIGRDLEKTALSQALKRLREKGYIETKVNGGKVIIKLTELGDDVLGLIEKDQPWDGKWRLVFYDIPEKHKLIRDLFRRRLKDWGFECWQRSIWITKSDVTIKLRKLIKNLGIQNWVVVIESNDSAIKNINSTIV